MAVLQLHFSNQAVSAEVIPDENIENDDIEQTVIAVALGEFLRDQIADSETLDGILEEYIERAITMLSESGSEVTH